MKLTLGRSVSASLGFALGVLFLMTGGSVWSIHKMDASAQMVAHTEEVEANISRVWGLLVEMESAERGFLLNGNEEYLQSYPGLEVQINQALGKLSRLVADNPLQEQRALALAPMVKRKLEIVAGLVAWRRAPTVVVAGLDPHEPKQVMDQIKKMLHVMLAEEENLLAQRRLKNDDEAARSVLAAGFTGGVGAMGLGAAAWVLHRQLQARRRAEDFLAQSRSQLQAILDNAPMCIYMKDLKGRFLLMNKPFSTWFGVDPENDVGKTVFDFFPRDMAEVYQRNDEQVLAEGRLLEFDQLVRHADGTLHSYFVMKFPLRDRAGKIYALCGLATDVTDRKRMELRLREMRDAAEAASKTKSQFLANMSHELRTPLNSVIGFSEILSDQLFGPLNSKQGQYIQNILASGRHLLGLINDLLDLAKIEAGRMRLDLETISVGQLAEQSVALVQGFATGRGVAVEGPTTSPDIRARLDAGKLKQILYNLLSNGIKFTPAGGRVAVTVAVVENPAGPPRGAGAGQVQPGAWVRLAVRDSGIGIAAENVERIFGEFEQVDTSFARQEQGTGLGLALTRRLAELHGGFVWAESAGKVNQGSTFIVLLPVAGPAPTEAPDHAAPAIAVAAAMETPTHPQPATGSRRSLVLVVEDDSQARNLLTDYLTTAGYDVRYARTGAEALKLAAELRPAAITLDILLPDASGLEVLAKLKNQPATAAIPVVIVSVTDDRELGLSLGAVEFFVKPVDSSRLLKVLAQARAATQRDFRRVLVVEDDLAERECISATLAAEGFNVCETGTAQDALALIGQEHPDMAVVDLTMPGMSGFELVNRLRQHPETQGLPVFIYTARDLTAEETDWLRHRVAAVTMKPFREQLIEELRGLCSGPAKNNGHDHPPTPDRHA